MSVFKWFTQDGTRSPICSNGYEICKTPNAIEWNSTFAPSSALASLTVNLAVPYTENDCEILAYFTTAASISNPFLTINPPSVSGSDTPYHVFIQGDTIVASHIYEMSIKDTKQTVRVTSGGVITDYIMLSVFITDLGAQARTV